MSRKRGTSGIVVSLLLGISGHALAIIPLPPASPADIARQDKIYQLDQAAIAAMKAEDYDTAEADARKSIAMGEDLDTAQEVLAYSLNAQGRTQEALKAYTTLSASSTPHIQIPYATLLLKTGQWAQAVAIYNQVLPVLGEPLQSTSHYSAAVPQPKELALTLLLAQGAVDDNGAFWSTREKGMGLFVQALHLAPNSALTNYFYYYGWTELYPDDPNKAADARAAQAALRKAASAGDPAVKKATNDLATIEAIRESNKIDRLRELQQKADLANH